MQVQYLEIVTTKVDETCAALAKLNGASLNAASFSAPKPLFGNARTAQLAGGGRIGVRASMRADEAPVVRPYMRVDNIETASAAIEAAGGTFAMTATDMPGEGKFAIYLLGGIEHGLWEP